MKICLASVTSLFDALSLRHNFSQQRLTLITKSTDIDSHLAQVYHTTSQLESEFADNLSPILTDLKSLYDQSVASQAAPTQEQAAPKQNVSEQFP